VGAVNADAAAVAALADALAAALAVALADVPAEARAPAPVSDAVGPGMIQATTLAATILAHPYTAAQRRALAAAFLDAEALAAALARAGAVGSRRSEATMVNMAALILAALKEVPRPSAVGTRGEGRKGP
jgi:hypothetical protein